MSAQGAQKGAAILAAMMVVTIVATLAATAVAWQTKNVEVQVAERARVQAMWLLRGAMDWSRLLLRQDAQSDASVDHLAEPWSVPLQETKLSEFISADHGVHQADASADMSEAFLAGAMEDLQAKINLAQLASVEKIDASNAVQRLFSLLNIPSYEYEMLVEAISKTKLAANHPQRLLAPRSVEDLAWFGLSSKTLKSLKSYAYWGESGTKINLNTASALVIQAAAEELTYAQAQALVNARKQQYFKNLESAQKVIDGAPLSAEIFTVNSENFMAQGWLRMDGIAVSVQAELLRSGTTVATKDVAFQGVELQ